MSDEQRGAFWEATHILPEDILLAIAMIVVTFYTLWVAWLAFAQARSWWTEQIELFDLIWAILRAAIMLLLVGYFIRP